MKKIVQETWNQVELTGEAEERIRRALAQGNPISFPKRRIRLAVIAAVICVLALTTAAVAATIARISMDVRSVQVEESGDTYTVAFKPTDAEPINLGDWYPDALPEGLELKYVSSGESGMRLLYFSGEEEFFLFGYAKANEERTFQVQHVDSVEWLDVGNVKGCLFTRMGGEQFQDSAILLTPEKAVTKNHKGVRQQILFWTDEDRGIGFVLNYVGEGDYDLTAIARSVAETAEPLAYTFQIGAEAAVRKLGDYQPGWLPEGYSLSGEYGETCNPLMSPDWYGYVHRVYRNEDYYELHLYYEYIPKGEMSQVILNAQSCHPVLIGQIQGSVLEAGDGTALGIVWEQTDEFGIALTFTVCADDWSEEELLAFAQSVYCAQEANTDRFER